MRTDVKPPLSCRDAQKPKELLNGVEWRKYAGEGGGAGALAASAWRREKSIYDSVEFFPCTEICVVSILNLMGLPRRPRGGVVVFAAVISRVLLTDRKNQRVFVVFSFFVFFGARKHGTRTLRPRRTIVVIVPRRKKNKKPRERKAAFCCVSLSLSLYVANRRLYFSVR